MAKITKAEGGSLKRLMETDAWRVLEQARDNRVTKLQGEEVNGSNEFETLRMLHKQQGKIEGLVEFFEDVEKLVFDE